MIPVSWAVTKQAEKGPWLKRAFVVEEGFFDDSYVDSQREGFLQEQKKMTKEMVRKRGTNQANRDCGGPVEWRSKLYEFLDSAPLELFSVVYLVDKQVQYKVDGKTCVLHVPACFTHIRRIASLLM